MRYEGTNEGTNEGNIYEFYSNFYIHMSVKVRITLVSLLPFIRLQNDEFRKMFQLVTIPDPF